MLFKLFFCSFALTVYLFATPFCAASPCGNEVDGREGIKFDVLILVLLLLLLVLLLLLLLLLALLLSLLLLLSYLYNCCCVNDYLFYFYKK